MDALQALLGADVEVKKDVYIKRLDTNFTIKPIDDKTFSKIREQATHYEGKGKNRKKVLDSDKLSALVILNGCANPDFSNADLKKKFDAVDGAEVVTKALYAGETSKLQDAIMILSGFEDDEEELEEVKN